MHVCCQTAAALTSQRLYTSNSEFCCFFGGKKNLCTYIKKQINVPLVSALLWSLTFRFLRREEYPYLTIFVPNLSDYCQNDSSVGVDGARGPPL